MGVELEQLNIENSSESRQECQELVKMNKTLNQMHSHHVYAQNDQFRCMSICIGEVLRGQRMYG